MISQRLGATASTEWITIRSGTTNAGASIPQGELHGSSFIYHSANYSAFLRSGTDVRSNHLWTEQLLHQPCKNQWLTDTKLQFGEISDEGSSVVLTDLKVMVSGLIYSLAKSRSSSLLDLNTIVKMVMIWIPSKMEMTELIRANELARIVSRLMAPLDLVNDSALTFWTTPDGSIARIRYTLDAV